MSRQSVNQVIQRAISDAAFRRQLQRDPQGALAGLDLTRDERTAITSADPSRLTALGVDQRMSKAFAIGGIAMASKAVISDAASGPNAAFIDESTSAGHGAMIDPGTGSLHGAVIDSGAAGASGAVIDSGAAGPSGAVIDAGAASPSGALIDAGSAGASGVIVGDPTGATVGGSSSVMAPDGTSFDAGLISGGYDAGVSAFEPTDASGSGTATLDAGAPTGSELGVDPANLGTEGTQVTDANQDYPGDSQPTEY